MSKAIVVMGVSGCGKSSLAAALAETLGWKFVEGDALHPPANIDKMARGQALTDADRAPFLANVGQAIAAAASTGVVASCSALKVAYRNQLRQHCPEIIFILPKVSQEELQRRVQARPNHFMPASLLASQLATLEPFAEHEAAISVDGCLPLSQQVQYLRQQLSL
ncbi:gluconokinase [Halioxenophilus aromaticivorans]|uniref:Gluconokinase n=1 Tax=Halioxenophilus aromaticivorans TaxID=1306992 RepID=A0AAV3U8U4_9ALTE